MNLSNLTSKQFVWAMLITDGELTTGKWDFYGGGFEQPDYFKSIHWADDQKRTDLKNKIFSDIENIGIDWAQTEEPQPKVVSCFEGTFHPASSKEILSGTLVLKNGDEYCFGGEFDISSILTVFNNIGEIEAAIKMLGV